MQRVTLIYESCKREHTILSLLVANVTTTGEIADRLHLTRQVVKNYISGMLAKTSTRNRTHLAVWAVQEAQSGLLILMKRIESK